jgi:RNA polymerase sigma factor (sigma-70 family)
MKSRRFNRWRPAPLLYLNEAARERAQTHVELARRLAWKYFRCCAGTVPLDELRGEALFALSYAAGKFDGERGVPFGAFARMAISHRLIHAINTWRRGGRAAHVRFTDLAATNNASCDTPCQRTTESGEHAALREAVDLIRQQLPPRWFRALQLYYVHEHTLEEVGHYLGITRERVRQLLTKALVRVRRRVPLYGWAQGW